jgi:hypothetical protein
MGEGQGGGGINFEPSSSKIATLPLSPSHQGRGNFNAFSQVIKGAWSFQALVEVLGIKS